MKNCLSTGFGRNWKMFWRFVSGRCNAVTLFRNWCDGTPPCMGTAAYLMGRVDAQSHQEIGDPPAKHRYRTQGK